MGHGFMLLCLGIYLIVTQAKAESRNPGALGTLYPARYMIFLMGFFAIYTGTSLPPSLLSAEPVHVPFFSFSFLPPTFPLPRPSFRF